VNGDDGERQAGTDPRASASAEHASEPANLEQCEIGEVRHRGRQYVTVSRFAGQTRCAESPLGRHHENRNDHGRPAGNRLRPKCSPSRPGSVWALLEFGCGNWSSAPHIRLDALLESAPARRDFRARLSGHGIAISALNCSGNPVHPGEAGRRHDEITRKTIRLARLLDVDRVGDDVRLPRRARRQPRELDHHRMATGGARDPALAVGRRADPLLARPRRLLAQRGPSSRRLCLDLHGHQNVYSVATLTRLRDAVGATVGANLDPSHLMWMSARSIAAARALGDAVYMSMRRIRGSIRSMPA
jgi:sugar phosphate isomerase/epimerase